MAESGSLIVSDIMTSPVVIGDPSETIKNIAIRMRKHTISSIIIVNRARQPIGIVSESDLVRKVLTGKSGIFSRPKARDIMNHPVYSIGKDRSISDAAKLMVDKNIRKLCVLGENGRLIGIVTNTDIMRVAGDIKGKIKPMNKTDMAVNEAIVLLSSNRLLKHEHGKRCYRLLKPVLYAGENTVLEVKQSMVNNIAPIRIIATNQRLIIARPSFWGLYIGHNIFSSTKYTTIPYSNITSVTMSSGMALSSIHVHLSSGSNSDTDEIRGLRKSEAEAVFGFLEKIVEYMVGTQPVQRVDQQAFAKEQDTDPSHVSMGKARRVLKENGKRFIWLGIDPVEFAVDALCVDRMDIYRVPDVYKIMDMSKQDLMKFEGCVLVCYAGNMSERVSKFLKDTHDINTYVLRGGIETVSKESSS